MSGVEKRLRELIARHVHYDEWYVDEYGQVIPQFFGFDAAELFNVLSPGSYPMYGKSSGYSATCGICAPDGDGVSGTHRTAKREIPPIAREVLGGETDGPATVTEE